MKAPRFEISLQPSPYRKERMQLATQEVKATHSQWNCTRRTGSSRRELQRHDHPRCEGWRCDVERAI